MKKYIKSFGVGYTYKDNSDITLDEQLTMKHVIRCCNCNKFLSWNKVKSQAWDSRNCYHCGHKFNWMV